MTLAALPLMKRLLRLQPSLSKLCAALFLSTLALAPLGAAEAGSGSARLTGLLGLAQYSRGAEGYAPAKIGVVLQSGDIIQSANGSSLDLDFGREIGTVRLLQSTTVKITSVSATNVQLELKGGIILGQIQKRSGPARFEVEIPNGLAGVMEGDFRLDTKGHLVLLEGAAIFVETATGGDPKDHLLMGGKPIYFSPPDHAIRNAPSALEKEVRAQLKIKLPKK